MIAQPTGAVFIAYRQTTTRTPRQNGTQPSEKGDSALAGRVAQGAIRSLRDLAAPADV